MDLILERVSKDAERHRLAFFRSLII